MPKFYQIDMMDSHWDVKRTIYMWADDEEDLHKALSEITDGNQLVEVTDMSHLIKIAQLLDPMGQPS